MNFDLTNEQESLRMRVRDFAEQEIKPVERIVCQVGQSSGMCKVVLCI